MPIDNLTVENFESFCDFFRADRALRYAYIFELAPKQWQPVLSYLHRASSRATYFGENAEHEYPHSHEEIFQSAPDGCFDWLQYECAGFSLAAYCWYPAVFTLTADPREFNNGEKKFQRLLDISRSLSQLAELPLIWSVDNWPPMASLRILPNGNIEEVRYRLYL